MPFDITLVSLTVRWLAGWYLGGRVPTLRTVHRTHVAPLDAGHKVRISVIVPARNEAASLPALLHSLAGQTCPPIEVIVVDDASTDATAEIASRAGATLLRSGGIPEGWLGKPWACAQGAAVAAGDILVFLDADTSTSTEFLERLGPLVEKTRSLVSIAPYHETQHRYELASALFNLVAFMGVGASSVRRAARVTGAFGPCMAMRRQDYIAIGGHRSVRGEVLEDMALARVCGRHDIPVLNVAGAADLRYRMYPGGLSQLVEGWSKNFAGGAGRTPLLRLLAIVAWVSGMVEAGVGTSVGVLRLSGGGPGPLWPYTLFYGLYAFQLWFLLRRLGNMAPVALVHPLATLAFLAICARSVVLTARGEVTWKGRTLPLPRRTVSRD